MKKTVKLTYKKMYQQPASFQAVNDTLEDIFKTLDKVFFGEKKYDELIFTGCGTSLYLASGFSSSFSTYTGIPAKGVPCSELYYFPETYVKEGRNVLILPITRKSYTTEVRMAIDKFVLILRLLHWLLPVIKTVKNIMTITFFHRIQLKTVLS